MFECERPERRGRRRGKNDRRDAVLAARRLPAAEEGLSELRGGGELRETLPVLLLERRSADEAGTAALNQLHALAVTAPLAEPGLRELARPAARARGRRAHRRLGSRALALGAELETTERVIEGLLAEQAAPLVAECGVGALTAAQLLCLQR